MPRVLAPGPRPADSDLLHCVSSPWSAASSKGRWRPARPAWPGSSGNGTDPGRHDASPEGGGRVEFRQAAIGHPKVLPAWRGTVSGNQAQFSGPGDGLSAVGGAPRSDTNPHSSQPLAAVYTPAQAVFARVDELTAAGARRVEFAACTDLARQLNGMRRAGTWFARWAASRLSRAPIGGPSPAKTRTWPCGQARVGASTKAAIAVSSWRLASYASARCRGLPPDPCAMWRPGLARPRTRVPGGILLPGALPGRFSPNGNFG
jgi:hypothetical protein